MAKKKAKRIKFLEIRYFSIAIGLLIFLLIAFLSEGSNFQLFQGMERGLLDGYFLLKAGAGAGALKEGVTEQFVANPKISDQIAIIGIDSDSLMELGRW